VEEQSLLENIFKLKREEYALKPRFGMWKK
jgi:hypothetical protein